MGVVEVIFVVIEGIVASATSLREWTLAWVTILLPQTSPVLPTPVVVVLAVQPTRKTPQYQTNRNYPHYPISQELLRRLG
jgi:hypothetical protein